MLNPDAVRDCLAACMARQVRNPREYPAKDAAKRACAEFVKRAAKPGDVALDVGGDEWYRKYFAESGVTIWKTVNQPEDMHLMAFEAEFDGAICLHVLEHSPFPLLVLELMKRAVRPGGWILFVVPKPRPTWGKESKPHVTVMQWQAWDRLRKIAGLELLAREMGTYNRRAGDTEIRFLCRVPA